MKSNYYVTDINKNTSIIEKMFSHDGEDFTKIFAYNKKKNEIIYIGTSYNKMQYYFNNNYVVLATEDEAEFVFDNNNFRFVEDKLKKQKAFVNVLKDAIVDVKGLNELEDDKKLIRAIVNRTK